MSLGLVWTRAPGCQATCPQEPDSSEEPCDEHGWGRTWSVDCARVQHLKMSSFLNPYAGAVPILQPSSTFMLVMCVVSLLLLVEETWGAEAVKVCQSPVNATSKPVSPKFLKAGQNVVQQHESHDVRLCSFKNLFLGVLFFSVQTVEDHKFH